ncbi:holo-ACP synthase [Gardnerella sp. 2492-Sm]|uniref:holo-ACP synthase n=1 Tax=unclassified Gardnerella TaxID=2628112 RepID=UPI003D02F858
MIAGLGHDIVCVQQFAQQMRDTTGWRKLFSTRELRQCALRAEAKNDDESLHVAARWAGKEAVIKAWSEALSACGGEYPYTLDNTPWNEIEIIDDSHGCPSVQLSASVEEKLTKSLVKFSAKDSVVRWHVSLTHDGRLADETAIASAVVILELLIKNFN